MAEQTDDETISRLIELREKKFDELVEHVRTFGKSFAVDPRTVVTQLTDRFKTKKFVSTEEGKKY
jgi:hypothetical protein